MKRTICISVMVGALLLFGCRVLIINLATGSAGPGNTTTAANTTAEQGKQVDIPIDAEATLPLTP